jgi:exonuclease SbcC
MILERLQISGFLSYKDQAVIDFRGFNLACISGANGAGKSSLLEAITWVLFGEARRRDDAVINMQTKTNTAEVILDFHYEGLLYQVQRSKPRDKSTILEFRVMSPDGWRVLTESTMRGTEELIRRTLHLDYETFINASFFLQGKADQFAQQRPADRKRILSGILGLEVWENYREEASRRRKQLEVELAQVNALLTEIETELAQESLRKARLALLEKEVAEKRTLFEARKALLDQHRLIMDRINNERKQVEKQRAEVQRVQVELDQEVENLEQRRREQEEYRLNLAQEDEVNREVAAWETTRTALAELEKLASNFHQYQAQRQSPMLVIERERSKLQTELDNLRKKEAEIKFVEDSLAALQLQVDELTARVNAATEKMTRRSVIESEIPDLLEKKTRLGAENRQLKLEMDEIKAHRDHLQQISGAVCPTCEKSLTDEERQRLLDDLFIRGTEKGNTHRANVKLIEEYETRYSDLELEFRDLKQVESELATNQRSLDSNSERLQLARAAVATWQEADAPRFMELIDLLGSDTFAPEARQELADIDARLKELGYDAAAHENLRQAELDGRTSQEKLRLIDNARASLGPLDREIRALEKTIEKTTARLDTLKVELRQADEKLELETTSLPDTFTVEQDYSNSLEQLNMSLNELGYARNEVEVLDRQREQKARRLEEKEALNEKITDHKTLERAFGKDGIPALLIEQALPDIQAHANEILDRLSSGGMSLTFETQREFKDKKRDDRRETLDILIRDSSGERAYEMFSGGEAFRVNFAIRLALSRVLAHRAGARLQTLVIDEGFGSQDADGRQRLVEAINLMSAEFEKILVITHLEELKDAFPARIEVTKTPSGSEVQVVVA